jgi:hypothetical protein
VAAIHRVRVERGGLEHQRIPAATANAQVTVGIARQADEADFQPGDVLFGDLYRAIQADSWGGLASLDIGTLSRDMAE